MSEDSCIHHWVIDTMPINGFYHAKCKKCSAEKDFPYQEPRRGILTPSSKPNPTSAVEPPERRRGRPRKVEN